jgi:lipopolysaccharide biosynthesis regulator YciM
MIQRQDRISSGNKGYIKQALQLLVQLYEATSQSEKAAEWTRKLAEFNATETEKKAALPPP